MNLSDKLDALIATVNSYETNDNNNNDNDNDNINDKLNNKQKEEQKEEISFNNKNNNKQQIKHVSPFTETPTSMASQYDCNHKSVFVPAAIDRNPIRRFRVWNMPNAQAWQVMGYSRCRDKTYFYLPQLKVGLDAGYVRGRLADFVFLTHGLFCTKCAVCRKSLALAFFFCFLRNFATHLTQTQNFSKKKKCMFAKNTGHNDHSYDLGYMVRSSLACFFFTKGVPKHTQILRGVVPKKNSEKKVKKNKQTETIMIGNMPT